MVRGHQVGVVPLTCTSTLTYSMEPEIMFTTRRWLPGVAGGTGSSFPPLAPVLMREMKVNTLSRARQPRPLALLPLDLVFPSVAAGVVLGSR